MRKAGEQIPSDAGLWERTCLDLLVSLYLLRMNYQYLLTAGEAHLEKYPGYITGANPLTLFPKGARWMHNRLNEFEGNNSRPFDPGANYTLYGYLKYTVCLTGFFLAIVWSYEHNLLLAPLSVLLFYLLEIQFLFLFPLLIDRSKSPILTGIRKVFRIGILQCLSTVIPISFFMLTGILRKGDWTRNWHIGCLAILIWYNNDVRNRI